jgi:hypothetical protein
VAAFQEVKTLARNVGQAEPGRSFNSFVGGFERFGAHLSNRVFWQFGCPQPVAVGSCPHKHIFATAPFSIECNKTRLTRLSENYEIRKQGCHGSACGRDGASLEFVIEKEGTKVSPQPMPPRYYAPGGIYRFPGGVITSD